jgi:UTP-glucose-1-phosphate uridylyltransferase/transcriptional regulator with XRE-family HTH domain
MRTDARLTEAELAKRVGISTSYIYYLEDQRDARSPSLSVVVKLTEGLNVTREHRLALLRAAGYNAGPISDQNTVLNPLVELVNNDALSFDDRQDLARATREFANHWKVLREKRARNVKKALILTAGWQPRLLSARSLERTLAHVADEVGRAGISQLVVVVAPETPENTFRELRGRLALTVSRVTQEQPVGLGNAILAARAPLEDGPFAVVLPDDVDPSRTALGRLVRQYERVRKPIVAVNPGEPMPRWPETRYYGIAFLGEPIDRNVPLYRLSSLTEKPDRIPAQSANARMIVGRYVLTPEIFDILQTLEPSHHTGKYELTDALAVLLRSQSILACELPKKLLPLAPVRFLIEKLIHSLQDRRKFEEILSLWGGRFLKRTTES